MPGRLTRRRFLEITAAGAAAAGMAGLAAAPAPLIPRRPLGKTGVEVSILGLGGGSNFIKAATNGDEALAILNACFEGGINYFDTANEYGKSQQYYGLLMKTKRDQVFLATKTGKRTRDDAMREVEQSLKRLQTDHIDLFQMHNITPVDTSQKLAGKDGVFTLLQELKAQKVIRFIGITGHTSAVTMRKLVEELDGLDTAFFPISAARDERDPRLPGGKWKTPVPEDPNGHFEIDLLPFCVKKGLGVLAMKSTGCGFLIGEGPGKADALSLIRYTMSVPGVVTTMVGPGSLANVRQNIAMAQNFKPMSEADRNKLSASLTGTLPQMAYRQPGYTDRVA